MKSLAFAVFTASARSPLSLMYSIDEDRSGDFSFRLVRCLDQIHPFGGIGLDPPG